MKRIFFVLLAVGLLGGMKMDGAAAEQTLADHLTYGVPRLVELPIFQALEHRVKAAADITSASRQEIDDDGKPWGGKTPLHELLVKHSHIVEDGPQFADARQALVSQLLARVKEEKGDAAVRALIQAQTAASQATARAIIQFYGSHPQASPPYEAGEETALGALLDQYDPPAEAGASGGGDEHMGGA